MQHGERKKRWILAVRRKSWNPTKHTRICGDHFVSGERIHGACGTEITRQYCCSGKPVEEPESVDYVPSIFSYNQHRRDNEAGRREQRRSRADRRRQILEIAEAEKEKRNASRAEGEGKSRGSCGRSTAFATLIQGRCSDTNLSTRRWYRLTAITSVSHNTNTTQCSSWVCRIEAFWE